MKRWLVLPAVILAAAAIHRGPVRAQELIVERPPADTAAARRMVLDPSEMFYQSRVDSLNRAMDEQIHQAVLELESNFDDPAVEERIGRLIGTIVMEKQLALLGIEVERAVSLRDTLLVMGLEYGLRELLRNSPELRETLWQQIDALERQFEEVHPGPAPR